MVEKILPQAGLETGTASRPALNPLSYQGSFSI